MRDATVHTFQSADPNDFTIVAGSELVISRTAYRDNSSNYYINAKKSHFKEVRDLLKSKAVDLDHNRFFTLQVCFILQTSSQ